MQFILDRKPQNGYFRKDEMPLNAAFHQDLHCLIRQNQSSEKELLCTSNKVLQFLDIINSDAIIYRMDHYDIIVYM